MLLAFATPITQMLIAALGVGIAGGSFAVGVAYVSRFYPAGKQGTALGIFGVGNVGAAVTKFAGALRAARLGLAVGGVRLGRGAGRHGGRVLVHDRRRSGHHRSGATPAPRRSASCRNCAPLKDIRVWRFALYYFFAFGAFVALALWLPRYLIGVYGFGLATAGMIGAAYSVPASIFRAYGGVPLGPHRRAHGDVLDVRRFGRCHAHAVPAADDTTSCTASRATSRSTSRSAPVAFIVIIFVLGFFMSLGKAAVYKHIPTYYPDNVGAVGGLVGMIGGLGGFVLPIAFGALNDLTGLWTSCFMLLFAIGVGSLIWMHVAIRRMERRPRASRRAIRRHPS